MPEAAKKYLRYDTRLRLWIMISGSHRGWLQSMKMATRNVGEFLSQLPSFLREAERLVQGDNVNILEHVRRLLEDNYVVISTLLQRCFRQEEVLDDGERHIVRLLREIHDVVLGYLERYNELCSCDIDGNDLLELNEQNSFVFCANSSASCGRPRVAVTETTLNELYSIYNSWRVVAS